jgi:L-ascorbate metabolism protein UlaG (beta-lactamase superfamily)
MHRFVVTRRGIAVPALVLLVLATEGCSSVVGRFMARAVTQMGSPIISTPQKLSSPLLDDPELAILWAGHATVLVQIRDKVFITDPNFTTTVGMVMRRKVEPGLDPASLDRVDYTLISHLHFDHFSYGSLDQLPQDGVLLLPQGSLPYTPAFGYREMRELKPWETFEEDGVRITAVPVQHFSGRYGFDSFWMRDRGYTGYVVQYQGTTVFFGGDTGYHPELFREIGRRFAIDVAMLPIAPIEPRDFMQRYHLDPAEALQVFEDVGARILVPIHHSTFVQGFDSTLTLAVDRLRELAASRGMLDRLVVLEIGEQRLLF